MTSGLFLYKRRLYSQFSQNKEKNEYLSKQSHRIGKNSGSCTITINCWHFNDGVASILEYCRVTGTDLREQDTSSYSH